MSPTLAVLPDPESGNGHGGDLEAELLRLLSQAALARSNEDAQRYEGIARFLAGLDYAAVDPAALHERVKGCADEHYDEHTATLEAWLAANG